MTSQTEMYSSLPITITRASRSGRPACQQNLADLVWEISLTDLQRQVQSWMKTIQHFCCNYTGFMDQQFLRDVSAVKNTPLLIEQAQKKTVIEIEAREAAADILMLLSELNNAVQGTYSGLPQDRHIRTVASDANKQAMIAQAN